MRGRGPADTLTPAPHRRDVAPTPHAALDVAMATGGTQRGQSSTDHPQTSHLATSPVLTPWIKSPSRNRSSLPMHATPTEPDQRRRAVQDVQSVPAIPVRLDPAWPRSSHSRARHLTRSMLPPPPCIAVHRSDRTEPESDRVLTEPARVLTEPRSHRQNRADPCT
jgi:hypothetical protein